MLSKIELTNFRKHTNATFAFAEGMHVIRGANEGGKSTIVEAVLYALFGSRALRSSLAETVTWGRAESELKVVLTLGEHVFTRSARGAEVTKNGAVLVTGQTDVTAFASSLIGADASVAVKLMLANQGNLRGSLEAGPKATALLIEELANFNMFDTLIDAMQQKLMLGAPNVLESIVKQQEDALAEFVMPVEPDQAAADARVAELQSQLDAEVARIETLKSEASAAEEAHATLTKQRAAIGALLLRSDNYKTERGVVATQLAEAAAAAARRPAPEDIYAQTKRVERASGQAAETAAWEWFQGRNAKGLLPMPVDAVQAAIDLATSSLATWTAAEADIRANIAGLSAQINHGTTCRTCGQALPDAAEINRRNVELEGQINVLVLKSGELKAQIADSRDTQARYTQAVKAAAALDADLRRYGEQFFAADRGTTPPTLTWRAERSGEVLDLAKEQAALTSLLNQEAAANKAAARMTALQEQLDRIDGDIATITATLEVTPDVKLSDVHAAESLAKTLRDRINLANSNVLMFQFQIKNEAAVLETARHEFALAGEARATLVTRLEQARANLEELNFNNGLLKKIRAARPIIADKLWSMVLAAVSTMFATMRGEPSVVAKDKDGFTVNGQAVASLSGSTLDLLGLAIRIALVKTFLPTCPFLILDEPAAACDAARSAALVGFIASAGFPQVVLVTHESLSETVADQIIELETT